MLANEERMLGFIEAIREAVREEMLRDENVFLMGEDIRAWGGAWGVFKGLYKEFGPERVRDTPISEAGFIGTGVGAATMGLRPVIELMFIDFMGVCMDQIYNQAAKLRYMFGSQANVPLVIRTQIGGGRSAAAHHSQSIYSVFAHLPGLKCVVPSTPYDAKGLMKTAIRDDNPVMYFEHKVLYDMKGPVPEEEYTIPFGVADIKREGQHVTVVATARMVHLALSAADALKKKEGVEAEVIDLRTIVPLDKKTIIDSVKKTGRLVVVDEDYERCGLAAEVCTIVSEEAFDYLDAPVRRIATPTVPIPFSPPLEKALLPHENKIMKAVTETVSGR